MIDQMLEFGWVSSSMIMWSVAAALVILGTVAFDRLFQGQSASVRHVLWVSATAGILTIPLFAILVPSAIRVQSSEGIAVVEPSDFRAEEVSNDRRISTQTDGTDPQLVEQGQGSRKRPDQPTRAASSIGSPAIYQWTQPQFKPTVGNLLIAVWLVGATLCILRIAFARRLLTAEFHCRGSEEGLFALTNRLAMEHGIEVVGANTAPPKLRLRAKAISLTITPREVGPLVWGSMPTRLLLPVSLARSSTQVQAAAICHELAHVLRRDEWTRRFLLIPRVLFWFHPAVRYCCNQVQLYAEIACDDYVLARGHKPTDYSDLLLKFSSVRSTPSISLVATSGMAQSQISRRIVSILKPDARRQPISWRGGFTILLLVALVAAGAVALRPTSQKPSTEVNVRRIAANATDDTKGRIISFPDDRTVGTVEVRPEQAIEGVDDLNRSWAPLGPAKGNVTVPAGYEVKLWVSADGAKSLSFLSKLPADAICSLDLWRSRLEDSQVPYMAHLTGLKILRLEDTRITSKGMLHLARLTNLKSFTSDSFMANNERTRKTEKTTLTFGVDDESATIFLSMPSLVNVSFRDDPITSRSLPILAKLTRLKNLSLLAPGINDDNLEQLSLLHSLHTLQFGVYSKGASITDAGARKVATITSLRALDLTGTKITKIGLAEIAKLPRLEKLTLGGLDIQPADLSLFRFSKSLNELDADRLATKNSDDVTRALSEIRSLRKVGRNVPVSREGLRLLLTLPELRSLSVSANKRDMNFAGIGKELAKCTQLEDISLYRITINDDDLLELDGLNKLRRLVLSDTNIRGPGLAVLAHMPELTTLTLSGEGDLDLSYLPELPMLKSIGFTVPSVPDDVQWYDHLSNLEHAHINGLIRDRHVDGLMRWTKLRSLGLQDSALSDSAPKRLAGLKDLEYLYLCGGFTSRGLRALDGLPRLQSLWVGSPYFGHPDVASLQHLLGSVSINVQGGESVLIPGKDGILRQSSKARIAHDALEERIAPPLAIAETFNGRTELLSLKEYEGKVVLLDFWATWCQPCVKSIPRLEVLRAKYAAKGFEIVGIHESATSDALPEFLEKSPISWPIGVDDANKSSEAYSNAHFPGYYLVDRSGRLRIAGVAPIDLEAAIQLLLRE
ncbi:MAG: redoxin domain-containing protein [Pirellulaceae bacterium]|nr:redoxin domain-containing protein [Pirellulaceae bacterium]